MPQYSDITVLPPRSRAEQEHASQVARIVAHWMDEFIRIPGTNIRMGLDPLLSLIPGVGGILSNCVSLIVLLEAVRLGVTPSVFCRMFLNIIINEVLDAVPVVGDAASIFFRSNSMNLELLERWKTNQAQVKRRSRALLIGLMIIFGLILAAWCTLIVFVAGLVWAALRDLLR